MLRMILAASCLLVSACTATGTIAPGDHNNPQDLLPAEVDDDVSLSAQQNDYEIDPLDLHNYFWYSDEIWPGQGAYLEVLKNDQKFLSPTLGGPMDAEISAP